MIVLDGSKDAKLNEGTYIDENTQMHKECFIGRGCKIYGKVKLMKGTHIGENTIIYGPAIIRNQTYIGPNCVLGHPDREMLEGILSNLIELDINVDNSNLQIGEECIIRAGSIIYKNVEIGDRVKFGHNIMIREGVKIGNDTIVGTNTVIDGSCNIGNNVSIQTGVYICKNSNIEDSVFLGPCCVFTNDKYVMQKETKLMGPTIKRGASIGANATLMPGIIVGEGAVVGAEAMVKENIPAKTIYVGLPARMKKPVPMDWHSLLGEKRKKENKK